MGEAWAIRISKCDRDGPLRENDGMLWFGSELLPKGSGVKNLVSSL